MARVEIPVTDITQAGTASPVPTAGTTGGMYVASHDGRVIFEVVSTDAGTQTVEFVTSETVEGLDVDDRMVTIDAGGTAWCGVYPTRHYNQTDGRLHLDLSAGTFRFRAFRVRMF